MLQLALALSLLHVDPDNFLQQRLRNWDSQLELRDGDGWELEMLRAVPMVEYPYANRKTMMPLIEDLIRYDRQHDATPPQYNVTAYMLNVQNDGGTNQTATLPELQATTSSTTSAASSVNVAGAAALEQAANAAAAAAAASTNASNMGLPASELDVFLNSENFQDQRSVWEQNLADLRDFGDLAVNNPYAGLPLKDEPYNNTYIDVNLDMFFPSFASAAAAGVAVKEETVGAGALNDTFPEPADIASIKTEQLDKEEQELALENEVATSSSSSDEAAPKIKKEKESGEHNTQAALSEEVDLSPFISQLDLIKEVTKIFLNFLFKSCNCQNVASLLLTSDWLQVVLIWHVYCSYIDFQISNLIYSFHCVSESNFYLVSVCVFTFKNAKINAILTNILGWAKRNIVYIFFILYSAKLIVDTSKKFSPSIKVEVYEKILRTHFRREFNFLQMKKTNFFFK